MSDLDGLLKLASLRGEVFKKSGLGSCFEPTVYSVLPSVNGTVVLQQSSVMDGAPLKFRFALCRPMVMVYLTV